MNQFYVTCYRGYSKVIGQIEFCKFFEQIGSNLHRRKIEQIEMALNEDNLTKADSIKRQLPFYTLTTNYSECRLPHSIQRPAGARLRRNEAGGHSASAPSRRGRSRHDSLCT